MEWHDILEFWFGVLPDDDTFPSDRSPRWWKKDPAFDREIHTTFGPLLEQAIRGELAAWQSSPRSALALVILLDQFSRNVFRDTPQAFAQDRAALAVSRAAIADGHDLALRPIERVFLYMPFMHCEDRDTQRESVALYRELRATGPVALADRLQSNLDFALSHARIVERFGRYPHRNAILGRTSTPEETAFLAEPGSSF